MSAPTERLTPRELQVLAHLADGLTLTEVCAKQYVSVGTAKTQTRSIYRKLGVRNAHGAVGVGLRTGLIPGCAVNPGREQEQYDAPNPELGFACGRGLGRCKES